MTVNEIRDRYLRFFEARGHTVIPSASLIPENDPTTLFTGSGMQPLLPFLLGSPHPKGRRLVNAQKCFRSQDIEEVGDNRHTTFFEMLGNWSLGDYFKEEQLSWLFEFLTKEIKLPLARLWVTCFEGDSALNLPRDNEAAEIWKKLGVPPERILFYGSKKNWWSRVGVPEEMPAGEPGGPDSEVFFDFGTPHDPSYGATCHPNCDCGRFMEIANSVFMQYVKQSNGLFRELPQKNVDFGGGLERIAAASNDDPDVFKVDVIFPLIEELEHKAVAPSHYTEEHLRPFFRMIVDHMRAAVFLIADGVQPGPRDRNYVVRRMLRRASYYAGVIGVRRDDLPTLTETIASVYKVQYPEISKRQNSIAELVTNEMKEFQSKLNGAHKFLERVAQKGEITGEDAFVLASSHGFPFELTREFAQARNLPFDERGYKRAFEQHRKLSRAGAEQKFKGGLSDHSQMSIKYHTATHLLHQALRDVLGPHVFQKGSNITPERLRFDFSHEAKLTEEEKRMVEDIINQKIRDALPVSYEDISIEEAEKRGAIGLFEEKYGEKVRVYTVGDYSLEYCGGPHVSNTRDLGHFRIVKEEAVSAGVRRIKAILE